MSGIFISWASSDAAIVDPLVNRLRGLGLNPPADLDLPRLWEYSHDMSAGDRISSTVLDAINQCRIAVLCLSDAALAKHKWIRREIDWCVAAKANNNLEHIIPIKVGETTAAGLSEISDLIATPDNFLFDMSKGSEHDLVRLCDDIFSKLGAEAPKLLPIAVMSMTEKEAADLFDNWADRVTTGQDAPLWSICEAVGMNGPPDVFKVLTDRYGARPEDMMPFGAQTLADLVHDAVADANDRRVAAKLRPVFPRWLHGELVGPDGPERQNARELWRSRDSLLIIDSLSIYSDAVMKRLQRVPPDAQARVATVCVPPYSRRTGLLDAALEQLVNTEAGLPIEPLFNEWTKASTDRLVTFDMSTSLALRSWLRRKFITIPKDDPAAPGRVKQMGSSSFKGTPGSVLTSRPK